MYVLLTFSFSLFFLQAAKNKYTWPEEEEEQEEGDQSRLVIVTDVVIYV